MYPISPYHSSYGYNPYFNPYHAPVAHHPYFPSAPWMPNHLISPLVAGWHRPSSILPMTGYEKDKLASVLTDSIRPPASSYMPQIRVDHVQDTDRSGTLSPGDVAGFRRYGVTMNYPVLEKYTITPDVANIYYSRY